MKRFVVILVAILNSIVCPLRAQDTLGVFDSVLNGIPDTVYLSTNPAFVFEVRNTGNSVFNDSIHFNFNVDSTASGAFGQSFFTTVDGPFTLNSFFGDSVVTNPGINSSFRGGINTVVIWPSKVPSSPGIILASDTIRKNVFVVLTTGIPVHERNSIFELYPNPATNILNLRNISVQKSGVEYVRIWDALGQKWNASFFENRIDLPSHLLPGMYFLEIRMNNRSSVKPFIKQ